MGPEDSDYEERAAQRRMSDAFLREIENVISERSRRDLAFNAGYLALLSTLTADDGVNADIDHPNAFLISLAAAVKLDGEVEPQDIMHGVLLAVNYHRPGEVAAEDTQTAMAWARRMRKAVGWE